MLVLPPGCLVALGLAGLLAYRRRPRLGVALMGMSTLALYLLSTAWFAAVLAGIVETSPALAMTAAAAARPQAIVVLGGGTYRTAPEYQGSDTVSRLTLERLRYAARLQRALRVPLAVSGGMPGDLETPEASLMRDVLVNDFRVPVRWIEYRSHDTFENARYTHELLQVEQVVLVTHALHMARAREAFETAGFTVLPAPLGFVARGEAGPVAIDFLPTMKALRESHYALYELVGLWWYRLRRAAVLP